MNAMASKLNRSKNLLGILAGAWVLALNGCGQLAELTPGTFSNVYSNTLKSCAQCHDGTDASVENGTVDFSSQALAYETLLAGTVSGITAAGTCAGVKLVDAGSPSTSYLLAVLFADYASGTGFAGDGDCVPYATHLEDQNVSASEKASMVQWIQDGAQNN